MTTDPAMQERAMIADGLTCTECFRPTYTEPDFSGLCVESIASLCRNWLCDDCLDAAEEAYPGITTRILPAAIQRGEHKDQNDG